jgi:LysR family transcriptional regulator, nod-box dependent transcriptional activator
MRINKLDLNQLAALDALLRERNVSRAADQLHLTQPALSASLARMRNYFGDPLLVPSGRTFRLTPFARSLVEPVHDLLLRAQALTRRRPELDPARIERDITIVASDYATHVLLAPLFSRAQREAPGLRFEVRPLSGYLQEELAQGDVDLVISIPTSISSEEPSEPLLRDTNSCVVWSGNTEVKRSLTLAQYLQLGHVVPVLGKGRLPTIDQRTADALGLQRRVEVRVPGFDLVPPCIVGTSRIGTLQTLLARRMAELWPLRVLRCPFETADIELVLQWHRHQSQDPAILWVRSALHDASRKARQEAAVK